MSQEMFSFSAKNSIFNVIYSHTRDYFSFVCQIVKKLNQTRQVQSKEVVLQRDFRLKVLSK